MPVIEAADVAEFGAKGEPWADVPPGGGADQPLAHHAVVWECERADLELDDGSGPLLCATGVAARDGQSTHVGQGNEGDGGHGITQRNGGTEDERRRQRFDVTRSSLRVSVSRLLCVNTVPSPTSANSTAHHPTA